MSKFTWAVMAAALVLPLGACGGGGNGMGGDIFGIGEEEPQTLTPQQFVDQAASGGMFEVQSSQLALDRNVDQETQLFAQRMLIDHRSANEELMAIAQRQGLSVPVQMQPKHADMLDELRGLQGEAFQRRYHELQEQAHQEAIALFENATESLQDPELTRFAERTLPTLTDHRDELTTHMHGE